MSSTRPVAILPILPGNIASARASDTRPPLRFRSRKCARCSRPCVVDPHDAAKGSARRALAMTENARLCVRVRRSRWFSNVSSHARAARAVRSASRWQYCQAVSAVLPGRAEDSATRSSALRRRPVGASRMQVQLALGHLLALQLNGDVLDAHREQKIVRLLEHLLVIARVADDRVRAHRHHS
jgi:hypothetical protein